MGVEAFGGDDFILSVSMSDLGVMAMFLLSYRWEG